ncbi:MAG: DUF1294 domain-containing protein [Lachnospiraceae bacterium]|nr:DUF1294 domain-containing protein [Lachnospiraceae bacterium]
MSVVYVLILYVLLVNLLGFYAMYNDKLRSKKRAFRIPEATLFTIAVIGGSIGSIVGMYVFRHKTRHWHFVYGMPLILILQIIGLVALQIAPIEIQFL